MENGKRWDLTCQAMPWDAADAVIFDIGNVLVGYTPEIFARALFPDDAQQQRAMLERVYGGRYWPMLDQGLITPEEAAKALVGDFGGSEAAYLRALTGWFELKVPVEEGWRAARRCKAMGKKLYLLSNYPDAGYHRLRERFADRFDPLFDGGCISYACHQLKPKQEIYETLIGMFGLNPSRTLFLDDTLANVEGAMRAGINGLWVDVPGKLDAFFGTGE